MALRPRSRQPLAGILALAAGCAIAGCGGGGAVGQPPRPSSGTQFDGAVYPPGVAAPDFALRNQLGRRVSLSGLRGQVVLLSFVSTNCRACALIAQQLRGALDELALKPTYGKGTAVGAMQVLFVSTDPRADTPAAVRRFLAGASLSERAQYLTGTETQLRPVWKAYRVLPASASRSASEAATTVLLIGRDGSERDAFGLEQITPEDLAHDIRLLRDG